MSPLYNVFREHQACVREFHLCNVFQGTLSMWRGISALQCIQGTTSEIFSKGVENGDFMGLEKVSLKCDSQGQAGTPTKVKLWGNTTLVCLMSTFINELFGEDNRERDTSQHAWSTWE